VESGVMPGPKPDVEDREILLMIRTRSSPIVTAKIIAERADMTTENANYRLKSLVDDGALESMRVGAAAKVYWLTDTGRQIAASVSWEVSEDGGSQ
jgi:DNA-binding Lrp family transcriptional regulator